MVSKSKVIKTDTLSNLMGWWSQGVKVMPFQQESMKKVNWLPRSLIEKFLIFFVIVGLLFRLFLHAYI